MGNYPNINSVKLEPCCAESIAEINKILKASNLLSLGVSSGSFVNMFGPSPSKINTITAVQQTDFVTFAEAMNAIPNIRQKLIFDISSHERLRHMMGNNVKLEKFWKGMMDASQ
jgi:hypothetical protein